MKIKRWIGVLLCMLLCVGMLPTMAFAADNHKVAIHDYQSGMGTIEINGLVSNIYYLVNIDGTLKVDGANESNYNIYYDENAAKLTINNLQVQAEDKWLLVPGGTTINVLGTNRIEPKENGKYGGGIAAVSDGDITITGSGSLYVKSASRAGLCRATPNNGYSGLPTTGGFTINGSVELAIDHIGAASCISANNGDITIGGSAKVTLDPRAGSDKDNGAINSFANSNVIVQDSAQVTSTGGFDTNGKIIINSGTVNITNNDASSVSLRGSSVEIGKNAKVTIASNTKFGQAVVSNGENALKIAGELEVTMTNEAPAGSSALYAQSYDITAK